MTTGEKIKSLREQKGMTLEELGNKVGVGKSTVRKWENGMIANMRRDKIAKLADALDTSPAELMGWKNPSRIIQNPLGANRIPVYSAAGAGREHLATDDILYYIDYSGDPNGVIGVVIDGNSMTPTIPNGSVVIADRNLAVESGDIVIAVINSDNEALCKRLKKYDDGIALVSDNPDYPPRYFSAYEVQTLPIRIVGKCTEVRKKL